MPSTFICVSFVFSILICGIAVLRGGPPERMAGYLVGAAWLLVFFGEPQISRTNLTYLFLIADAVLAVGLLALAIRYAVLWLGAAMILQSGAFALHAWLLGESGATVEVRNQYILGVNLLSYGVLTSLLVGTVLNWRDRNGTDMPWLSLGPQTT